VFELGTISPILIPFVTFAPSVDADPAAWKNDTDPRASAPI
jgi:hypothetical protein